MQERIHPRRLTRSRRTSLVAATLLSGVLVAGCGGSSPSLTSSASSAASGATTAGSSTATGRVTTSSGSTAPGGGGSGPLAFARCMRANGVPSFPDPSPGGGAKFDIPAGTNQAAPAFQAAQAKCQKLMEGGNQLPGPGQTTDPTEQTLLKLRKIAVCMRAHGISGFPDPRTSVPSNPAAAGIAEITDFDGAILLFPQTMNVQAPAYKQALTACGAPPLGLPH